MCDCDSSSKCDSLPSHGGRSDFFDRFFDRNAQAAGFVVVGFVVVGLVVVDFVSFGFVVVGFVVVVLFGISVLGSSTGTSVSVFPPDFFLSAFSESSLFFSDSASV